MDYQQKFLIELCQHCITVAKDVGRIILEYYNNFNHAKDVKIKADNSPVTNADLKSHQELTLRLNQLLKLPVLSEESDEHNPATRLSWHDYWLIDPIDGTKEFIAKNGEFCINIALIHKNRPILGIIYAPYLELLYYAVHNHGAYKIEKDAPAIKIHTNRMKANFNGATGIVIAASRRYRQSHKYANFIDYLTTNNIKHQIILAGSALKFGLVAEGRVDLYPRFGLTGEWDTAAGDCIVKEAGGAVKNLQGKELKYNIKQSLINPEFYVAGDKNFQWDDILVKI